MPNPFEGYHAGESGEQRTKRLAEEAAKRAANTTDSSKDGVGLGDTIPGMGNGELPNPDLELETTLGPVREESQPTLLPNEEEVPNDPRG